MFKWLEWFSEYIVEKIFGIPENTKLYDSLTFFIFDTVKIFILLFLIVFIITFIRSYFSPEKVRMWLSKSKISVVGNIAAALLGIITPFCSCSAVPLFIGFVEANIPLGITFSYLIAAPMVNEVALGLLYSEFGLRIALIYVITGEIIAIISGIIIGKLKLERYIEEYVFKIKMKGQISETKITIKERLSQTLDSTKQIIRKVWLFIIIGVAIGSVMHGWVPSGILAHYAGKNNPFAVIFAVLLGVPLYSNAAGVIPLVKELTRLGVANGTALSFMMATTALSIPEMILLRRVLKPRLLAIFIGIVTIGIIFTGYLFNIIL